MAPHIPWDFSGLDVRRFCDRGAVGRDTTQNFQELVMHPGGQAYQGAYRHRTGTSPVLKLRTPSARI